jgi:hypothetical protein
MSRIRCLIAALWAGSLWTVGYLVAPTLFATLADRVLAGTVAASMFRSQAWLSIACAVLLLALLTMSTVETKARRTLLTLSFAILFGTLVVHFGLQPMMAALREAAGSGGVMESAQKARFGMLHGISSIIFMLQSLLAGVLVWKMR